MRKLLTITAVLAMETPIVLLDEPTLGQDGAGRALIIGILRRLRAAGRTVIVAGHDRALMAATLDRTVTLARPPHLATIINPTRRPPREALRQEGLCAVENAVS